MGDYRITVEAVGGHGCGREAKNGEVVPRCGQPSCPDCKAQAFVEDLKKSGNSVAVAKIEHWPVPGAAGCSRNGQKGQEAGPIDDLLTGIRKGAFALAILAVTLLGAACVEKTNQEVIQIPTQTGPGPVPTPTPTPNACSAAVDHVSISGATSQAVGSTASFSAHPIDVIGNDLSGAACSFTADWSPSTLGAGAAFVGDTSSLSVQVKCSSAGTETLTVIVAAKTSKPYVVTCQ